MRSRHLVLGLVLVCALAAAGCGGGGTKIYTAAKSRACLVKNKQRVTASPASDLVASAAEGDAFSVRFRGNLVTVSFGLDRNEAEHIVRAYQRFRGKNIGLADVLKVEHNAVMLWAVHPQDAYLAKIEACLK